MNLPDLHDATLQTVNFEWDCAKLRLTFKTGIEPSDTAVIEALGVTDLKCPHLSPWGPSNSVNTATLDAKTDKKLLIIEMQSGDVLQIASQTVTLNSIPL
jgi:hypothetical protein